MKQVRYCLIDNALHIVLAVVLTDLSKYREGGFSTQGMAHYQPGIGQATMTCYLPVSYVGGKDRHDFVVPLDHQRTIDKTVGVIVHIGAPVQQVAVAGAL